MKYQLNYSVRSSDTETPCSVMTSHLGEYVCGIGKTWEQARERCLANLKVYLDQINSVPKPETVNIGDEAEFASVPEVTAAMEALGDPEQNEEGKQE